MTPAWRFPPRSREIQLDERWSFVEKKEAHCTSAEAREGGAGDNWDHTAVDADHRLVLALVPGKRTGENCEQLVREVHRRTGGRTNLLFTSDEHAPYETAIAAVYAHEVPVARRPGPGRPPKPRRLLPPDLADATVRKTRRDGRVVQVVRTVVFGASAIAADRPSAVSQTINTAFVERNNGTARGQNSRLRRKTLGFSKDGNTHHAASFFTADSYNFCWPVRTLTPRTPAGCAPRTPAMSAGLAAHVWPLREWVLDPTFKPT